MLYLRQEGEIPEMDREQEAVVHCHGLIFTGRFPGEVFREVFAPDAKSEWAGTLPREDVYELYKLTPAGRQAIERENLIRLVLRALQLRLKNFPSPA